MANFQNHFISLGSVTLAVTIAASAPQSLEKLVMGGVVTNRDSFEGKYDPKCTGCSQTPWLDIDKEEIFVGEICWPRERWEYVCQRWGCSNGNYYQQGPWAFDDCTFNPVYSNPCPSSVGCLP